MSNANNPDIKSLSPQLLVADLERAVAFYCSYLGFGVGFRYGDFYAGLERDHYSLHLKADDTRGAERSGRRDNEHADIVFAVGNISEFYHEVIRQSPEVVVPLREMPYGREFYIADPDGYILAFVETK
ncbi:MAG TPA: VOC family protein [Mucilaginibacter sp.]|nr:VOC family protein [Mucilaginibacter sp.]